MTAEIAIANGSAVALAADSAVTIGGRKIYNSAIKLFSLSKLEPVGIMIYGNASLLDVPWETIIKTCRNDIGGEAYPELEDYGAHLIGFIKSHGSFFSQSSQNGWVESNVRAYFKLIEKHLDDAVREFISNNGPITIEKTAEIF